MRALRLAPWHVDAFVSLWAEANINWPVVRGVEIFNLAWGARKHWGVETLLGLHLNRGENFGRCWRGANAIGHRQGYVCRTRLPWGLVVLGIVCRVVGYGILSLVVSWDLLRRLFPCWGRVPTWRVDVIFVVWGQSAC